MSGPWERYKTEGKPWERFAAPEQPQDVQEQRDPWRSPSKILNTLVGAGENVITSGVGLADTITAGYKGLGAAIIPGGKTGKQAFDESAGKWSYTPRSETGQIINDDLSLLGSAIEKGADYVGEVSGDPTDTVGATGVKTALLALPMLLGLRSGRGGKKQDVAPTIDELKTRAAKSYDLADNSGVAISRNSFESFVDRVMDKAAKEGIDPKLTPDSMAILERLMDKSGNNFTLKGLEIERKAMIGAGNALNKADQRMASIIRREMDDYVENLGPNDMFGNTDTTAISALKDARSNWSKARKSEKIARVFDKADVATKANYTVAGYETALRQGFKNLYERISQGRERGFSADEIEAIRKVVTGGPIQNFLREIGKFTPKGAVSGAASAYIAQSLGGPLAVAIPTAAWASRGASASKTIKNAKAVDELIRGGKKQKKLLDKKSLIAAGILAPDR